MTTLTIKTANGINTNNSLIYTQPQSTVKKPTAWVVQDSVTHEKQAWFGANFTYDTNGNITGGTANRLNVYDSAGNIKSTVQLTTDWNFATQAYPINYAALLTGDDSIIGGNGNDILGGGNGINTNASGVYTYNGHSYLLSNNTVTWTQAQAEAKSLGGNLVTINDQAEQNWIFSTFKGVDNWLLWIGYTDQEAEGVWKWISGEISTYTNWNSGEPNNAGTLGEDYAHIYTPYYGYTYYTGRWNDIPDLDFDGTTMRGIVEINNAGTGEDILKGGLGNDTYIIDSTGDKVTENTNAGNDTVQSSITYKLPSNVENLVLTGSQAINGLGNSANNIITGNTAHNMLVGFAGNDILDGGLGDDNLQGGNGIDTAVYSGKSIDYKIDYQNDTIQVSDSNFGDGNSGIDSLSNIEKLQFSDITINTQTIIHNEMVHTGALFAILSYGEASLWADQNTTSGWTAYASDANKGLTVDEGFDDNYNAFFTDKTNLGKQWTLLTNTQLGDFDINYAHANFTNGGLYNGWMDASGSGLDNQYHEVTKQVLDPNAPLTGEGSLSNNYISVTEKLGDSNAIVARDSDTLVLAFRGTDDYDNAVDGGQTFTGDGAFLHYEAFRPLIEKVYQYLQTHTDIHHIVVSGHSLGGAMADTFTAIDGNRFDALPNSDLTVVSLASAGLDTDAFTDENDLFSFNGHYDTNIIKGFHYENRTPLLGGNNILNITTPSFYIGLAHNADRVFHSYPDFGLVPLGAGLLPVNTLVYNAHFKTTDLNLPNVGNLDVDYSSTSYWDNGFGAHHNGLIYYKDINAFYSSSLINNYTNQKLIFGIGDYVNHSAWFTEGNSIDDIDYNGIGDGRLNGTSKGDFIFGIDGNDVLNGKSGDDLLDGGWGDDTLTGGLGSDKMAGGLGSDTFVFSELDSAVGTLRDVITDFISGTDKIDLSKIDASDEFFQDLMTFLILSLRLILLTKDKLNLLMVFFQVILITIIRTPNLKSL